MSPAAASRANAGGLRRGGGSTGWLDLGYDITNRWSIRVTVFKLPASYASDIDSNVSLRLHGSAGCISLVHRRCCHGVWKALSHMAGPLQ
jgi:hypothetical protein